VLFIERTFMCLVRVWLPGSPRQTVPSRRLERSLNQMRVVDSCSHSLRPSSHSSKSNGRRQKDGAYQNTENAPDERVSMFDREDTGGKVRLFANNGDKSKCRKPERKDDQTQVDR
jgi:hypothetical protein